MNEADFPALVGTAFGSLPAEAIALQVYPQLVAVAMRSLVESQAPITSDALEIEFDAAADAAFIAAHAFVCRRNCE